LSDITSIRKPIKPYRPRRLSEIPDKEGKVRIVAICDYWTQSLLHPLHIELNKLLREIVEDCTFNQNNYHRLMEEPGFWSEIKFSIDLKSATDMMPSDLQAYILGRISSNKEIGSIWHAITSEQEWSSSIGTVRYAQGQPMGLYSS